MTAAQGNKTYGAHNRPVDPNFKFCSFCKNDQFRKDNLRFSHWLRDPTTGQITCPFLLSTVCGICLEYGHTTNKCTNQHKLDVMKMDAMCIGESAFAKLAVMEYDNEVMRRNHMKWYLSLEKSCGFCANYGDEFHKTHQVTQCPRLLCMTCKFCGMRGHTITKCPVKINKEMYEADTTKEFVIDFDEVSDEKEFIGNLGHMQPDSEISDDIDMTDDAA